MPLLNPPRSLLAATLVATEEPHATATLAGVGALAVSERSKQDAQMSAALHLDGLASALPEVGSTCGV